MKKLKDWSPPDFWQKITTLDVHTEGEPLRIITSGFPDLPGETILARRQYAMENLDHLRTSLMWEPRGHADMYGCIITPPVTPEADIGILFMHNEGFSTMCGHGIIGITKVVLETGLLPITEPETTVRIDTPAGLVTAYARVTNNQVQSVFFHNVPSFVFKTDKTIQVPGLGKVCCDIAFGGAFYAYVKAENVGLTCTPEEYRVLIEKGMAIKRAVMENVPIKHPFEDDLNFLYGTIFTGSSPDEGVHSRNVCIFAEGEVDRSPTGTGVSGHLAILHAREEIVPGQPLIIESIIGSQFKGKVVKSASFGSYSAIIPEVEGSAYITGRHEFFINPEDPLHEGFILR
ncbi:MAG: proline racemase family protein [Candidatus Aminicenantes bacterium]|nr:proline racemase family protein [Candidatus Aminicenantes bacterium]